MVGHIKSYYVIIGHPVLRCILMKKMRQTIKEHNQGTNTATLTSLSNQNTNNADFRAPLAIGNGLSTQLLQRAALNHSFGLMLLL